MTEHVLALVGCGDKKRSEPTEARALYTSDYFHKKRKWAEGCDEWRILSAEYGLVQPTTVLEPYDTVLSELDEDAVIEWATAVRAELNPLLADIDVVVVLAGSDYFDPIEPTLTDAAVSVCWPFDGKRIGEQIAWLTDTSSPKQLTFETFE